MARPKKEVNEQMLQKLTMLHLSDKVIAEVLEVSEDTLHRRYSEQMEMWRSMSKAKIGEVLFDEALNKRTDWALKTVSQRHLGYADKSETKVTDMTSKTDEQLLNELRLLRAKVSDNNES
jgi:AraC-like DNA-binding protein